MPGGIRPVGCFLRKIYNYSRVGKLWITFFFPLSERVFAGKIGKKFGVRAKNKILFPLSGRYPQPKEAVF